MQPRKTGLFLIRESTNFPGDYTLCVCADDKVEHHHIISQNNKFTIDEEDYYDSLTQLVEVQLPVLHLKSVSIVRKKRKPLGKCGAKI